MIYTITSPLRMANCLSDYFTSIGGKIGDSCSDHSQTLNHGRHMSGNQSKYFGIYFAFS
jgi:hypothetical protein